MSTLFMISLPLDLGDFRRWAALRSVALDEGRALHHLLSETFGKGALQPFRLMVARGARRGMLYAYTRQDAESLRQMAREVGMPEAVVVADPARIEAKEMPPTWREGRHLAFDVRIRPVRRLNSPLEGWSREEQRRQLKGQQGKGAFRKGSEVDAFLVARLRRYPEGMPDEEPDNAGLTREAIYRDWLAERLGGAAELCADKTRLAHFERTIIERNGRIEGPDATLHGELTITDGAAFADLLASGLGRHTAYGYGMLLLRPAGR